MLPRHGAVQHLLDAQLAVLLVGLSEVDALITVTVVRNAASSFLKGLLMFPKAWCPVSI